MKKDVLERFVTKFERRGANDCWPWTGAKNNNGRGVFSWTERVASRAAYVLFVGPIPDGQVVRHTCDNGACVNPAHLLLGSQRDNMQDAIDRHRFVRGEASPNAKLDEDRVRSILTSTDSIEVLADRYSVSPEMIGMIQRGLRWKHVEVEALPERVRQRRLNGRYGQGHWNSSLTDDQVREIRASNDRPAVIAARFGISRTNVYHIRKRDTWAHVSDEAP